MTCRNTLWPSSIAIARAVALVTVPAVSAFQLLAQTPAPDSVLHHVSFSCSSETNAVTLFRKHEPHITAGRIDTTLRANDAGTATFRLSHGQAHAAIMMVGFRPFEGDIVVPQYDDSLVVILQPLTTALETREVTAQLIGIRGVIGDSALTTTLADVAVHAPSGDLKVRSDSAGRFSVQLDRAGPVVLRLDAKGYVSKVISVNVAPVHIPTLLCS